jgi:outer membrane protein assembly factor BamB
VSTIVAATLLFGAMPSVVEPAAQAAPSDWPQYCGPTRDGNALGSPKLLDEWPKEGPPLAWKSDSIPGWTQGGCAGPVVADGRVFVYATAKTPVGGGTLYRIVTPELLAAAGWMPDLPADLAKKLEAAWSRKDRPSSERWTWWIIKDPKLKQKELDAFLAKQPELDKYLKDFLATLKPEHARKYGDFIKRRLCIDPRPSRDEHKGIAWDDLVNLSKLQGAGYPTLREWAGPWEKATHLRALGDHLSIGGYLGGFFYDAWWPSFTRSDTLVCLDADTGKTLWKKDFPVDADVQLKLNVTGGTHNGAAYLGLCGTPSVWQGRCYFSGAMGLYCVSVSDGRLVWQVNCPFSHTSVLVANGVVYYCGAAYHAETGKLLWKTPRWKGAGATEWTSSMSPLSWKSGGKTYVLAGNGQNVIYCLDLETGKDLWSVKVAHYQYGPNYPTVRSGSDTLMVEGQTYRMTPAALQPLKALAEFPPENNFMANRLIYQDHLYGEVDRGHSDVRILGLSCWDLRSGALKWSTPNVDAWWTPSILADGKIIMANGVGGQEGYIQDNWKIMMIRATPEKCVRLGSFAPGMIPWTPMALAGGKLLVRRETGISCYDLRAK